MEEFNVKIDIKELQKLKIDLHKFGSKIEKRIMQILDASGIELVETTKDIINDGPARTGRIYKLGGREHIASAKGEPAKNRSGNLVRSIAMNKINNGVEVGALQSVAPYAEYLEDVDKMDRRFLYPSYKKLEPQIQNLINKSIKESL